MSGGISVRSLEKGYRRKRREVHAVRGLDFEVSGGSLAALLGPNGAGKSTTVRMICGLCRPTAGSVEVCGIDPLRDRRGFLRRIGLVSQHYNIDQDLTGFENMIVHAHLFGMRRVAAQRRIEELLDFAELTESRDRLVSTYSGGMKRKLQIVRSLLHDPEVLILDEPTVGLDPASRAKVWDLITGLNERGRTVLFTTHYIEEAEQHAGRVLIMHRGVVIRDGEPTALIGEVGTWCRETFARGATDRRYYDSRERAEASVDTDFDRLVVRPTHLEDVFISLTGDTMEESA
jgi:ABC-2 type transport system ATP-binding protein